MNYDELIKSLAAQKYESPNLGATTPISVPDFRVQGSGSSGGGLDPKVAGALANLMPKEQGAEPTPPIGQADGKPVYDLPVDPAQGQYLPGGTPATAGSANIQQQQPGSDEWIKRILAGVGMQ